MSSPHAPWELAGEALVGMVRQRAPLPALPEGLEGVPGPCLVVGVRYSESPVGPYLELAFAEPARLGARLGICVVTMVATSSDARVGGRVNWGFPKELGTLRWSTARDRTELVWEERGIVVAATAVGPAVPVLVPLRALQRRSDGLVVVPGRLRGRARLARVDLSTPPDDVLAGLAGHHPGVTVSGMRLVMDPARLPEGLTATLRAPLRAPEPALSWGRQAVHAGD